MGSEKSTAVNQDLCYKARLGALRLNSRDTSLETGIDPLQLVRGRERKRERNSRMREIKDKE